jgi:hypothetical protein
MKKQLLWMWAAILFCGLVMPLSSCSDNDDAKDNGGNVVPDSGSDNYTIEVGPGMKLNVNEFETRVPRTSDYDQDIFNTLKGLDRVTDVKPYKLNVEYGNDGKAIKTVTAYYFNYKQDIDHGNPSLGWFKQQCVLTVAGKDRPTVVHTNGYALSGADVNKYVNDLDSLRIPTLVGLIGGNCLWVEHRYQGWSLPEGWTNKWNYLSAKQQSDDIHAVVTAIKSSGIISKSSKWIATGVSKDGETTAYYAYHYPTDMDAYVPFCAPFLTDLHDSRPNAYITYEGDVALGSRKDKIITAFRTFFSNKKLQAEAVALFKKMYPDRVVNASDEELRLGLLQAMYGNHFSKMSYVAPKKWEGLIPSATDGAEAYLTYIMADENTRYGDESNQEYNMRNDYADDFYDSEFDIFDFLDGLSPSPRRAQNFVVRNDPYEMQCMIDLGNIGWNVEWVKDIITNAERDALIPVRKPYEYGLTYDNGKFINAFLNGMKTSNCHMLFVYGKQDPWTGAAIAKEGERGNLGPNSTAIYIEDGIHNDFYEYWTPAEQATYKQWLKEQGFTPVK